MVETPRHQAKRRCCHARGSGHPETGSHGKARQRLDSRFRGNDSRGIIRRLQVDLLGTQRLVGGSNSVRVIVGVVGGIVGRIRIDRVWAVVRATGVAIRRARIVRGLIRVVIL